MIPPDQMKPHLEGSAKQPRWALFKRQFKLNREDGVAYLTRWWLFATPWGGLAVHRIRQPDYREWFHDHEADFISLVLWGAYEENILKTYDQPSIAHRVWLYSAMPKETFHRLVSVERDPTWTLVLIGKDRGRL